MGRKKNAEATGQADGAAAASGKPANKTEAVRIALGALGGKKASPAQIDEYLRREFQITMSLPHISNVKSVILGRKGKRRGKKGERPAPAAETPAAPQAFSLQDMREVRAVVGRVGVEKFKDLRQFREVLDLLYP